MSTIVIMPGGFHPFHAGHAALYKSAVEAFPNADVYVAATNDTKTRPFPFAIKEKLAKLAGVAQGHFIQVKSPFKAEEITSHYNPNEDVLIFVRSEKDKTEQPKPGGTKKDGSPAYFQPWTGKNLQPFSKHAYIAYLPTVEFGPGIKSATEIRNAWPNLDDRRKTAMVMSLYPVTQKNPKLAANVVKMLDIGMGGQVDEGIFDLFKKKPEQQRIDPTLDTTKELAPPKQKKLTPINPLDKLSNDRLRRILRVTEADNVFGDDPAWFKTEFLIHEIKPNGLLDVDEFADNMLDIKGGSLTGLDIFDEEGGYLEMYTKLGNMINKELMQGVADERLTKSPPAGRIDTTTPGNQPAKQDNKSSRLVISKEPNKNVNPELQKRLAARKAGNPKYGGGLEEGSQSKDDLIWTLNNFDYYTDNGSVYVNDNGDKIARIGSNWKHQSGKMGSGAEELSAFLSSLQDVNEGFGINYPGTYEQENNMFKGHGQRRIGNLTSENIDSELINVLQYAQQHYPNSKNKQEAFMKFVQRALGHSKSDDERQDNELERLDKEVDQLQKQVNVTESTDYLEEK
jgi:hypothetical protein